MAICITRMNENMKAILRRDHFDCKQKCLTGYLNKNKYLFQNEFPKLTSRCCCRHLQQEGKKSNQNSLNALKRTSGNIYNKNENILCTEAQSHREKIPCSKKIPQLQYFPRKKLQPKIHPSIVCSDPRDTELNLSRDSNMCRHYRRKKHKVMSERELNSNTVEKRVPSILLTTTGTIEAKRDRVDMKACFKRLPSLRIQEPIFSDGQRSTVHHCYDDAAPRKLICSADNDKSIKEKKVSTGKNNLVLFNDMCYNNTTLQDLVDFNVVSLNRN